MSLAQSISIVMLLISFVTLASIYYAALQKLRTAEQRTKEAYSDFAEALKAVEHQLRETAFQVEQSRLQAYKNEHIVTEARDLAKIIAKSTGKI